MSFPLFHRPGTVVFLDDDPDYLEMLALVLPRHWHVKLFLRPVECINYLQQEPPFWEADAWNQQQLIDHWRERQAADPADPGLLVEVHRALCAHARVRRRLLDARHGRPAGAGRTGGLARLARAADGAGRRTGCGTGLQPRPDRPVHRQADAGHLAPADRSRGAPAGHAQCPACADLAGHAEPGAERAAAHPVGRPGPGQLRGQALGRARRDRRPVRRAGHGRGRQRRAGCSSKRPTGSRPWPNWPNSKA